MLKRARRKREMAKNKYKGRGSSLVGQIASTTMNLARNAVEGIARREVNVNEMNDAYRRVGD